MLSQLIAWGYHSALFGVPGFPFAATYPTSCGGSARVFSSCLFSFWLLLVVVIADEIVVVVLVMVVGGGNVDDDDEMRFILMLWVLVKGEFGRHGCGRALWWIGLLCQRLCLGFSPPSSSRASTLLGSSSR